jgi:trehalose 6-phosphate synthase
MAAAIKAALEMPLNERKKRFQRMYDHLAENDIDRWADRFLLALGETREQPGLLSSLRQLFAVRG